MNQNHFKQLVKEPTHIEGNLLDHAYVLDTRKVNQYTAVLHSKYYTDHRGVGITIKRLVFRLIFNKLLIPHFIGKLNEKAVVPKADIDDNRNYEDEHIATLIVIIICNIIEI